VFPFAYLNKLNLWGLTNGHMLLTQLHTTSKFWGEAPKSAVRAALYYKLYFYLLIIRIKQIGTKTKQNRVGVSC